jgi:hypothetical protein
MTNQPLSKLQKHILTLAEQQEYVCYKDVLQSWYGFVPNRMTFRQNQSAYTNHDHVRREISTARVGICKAFNRLAARGLVHRVHEPHHWSTVTLNKAKRG